MIERLGLVMRSFPVLTQVFVVNEVNALEDLGLDVTCFSLTPVDAAVTHAEAQKWLDSTINPGSISSPKILYAHLWFSLHNLKRYLAVWSRMRFVGKRWFHYCVYFALLAQYKRIQHVHAYFAWAANMAQIIAYLNHVSFSFSLVNSDLYCSAPHNLEILIQEASFCVTISEYNRNYILQTYPVKDPEKIQVIYHGIEPGRFVPPEPKSQTDVSRLLTVARLVPVKNIPFLLELCTRLREMGHQFTCDIVGEGPERESLGQLAVALGLNEIVRFKGAMTQEELVLLYQTSDVFILTSVREGMPVSLMEAMSTGLPVVASNIMANPELIEHGSSGFLFSPNNLEEAARMVSILLNNKDLRIKIGEKGRRKVERDCDAKRNAQKLYQSLIRLHQK